MAEVTLEAKALRRDRWAWYLYDFGNSAYAAVVLLAVYATYFKDQVVGGARGSQLWGVSVGIAMLVVTVISPILGCDRGLFRLEETFPCLSLRRCPVSARRCYFLCRRATSLPGCCLFILAEIGYRSAQVFYNALLPEIASGDEMGRVSGTGWAIGSAGGVICLLIILPLIMIFDGTLIVRLSLVITAVYFALSALPMFLRFRERAEAQPLPKGENYVSMGIKRLKKTLGAARNFREFIKFVIAFLVYNDAVIMALDFASIIGAVLFGMEQQALIIFVIIVQVTNVVGAYVFGYLTDKLGGKRALIFSITRYDSRDHPDVLCANSDGFLFHRRVGWVRDGGYPVGEPDDGGRAQSGGTERRVLWLLCCGRAYVLVYWPHDLWLGGVSRCGVV